MDRLRFQASCLGEPLRSPSGWQAYVHGLVEGKSKRQSALDAGYSTAMADHASSKIETQDVRKAFAALIQATIPPERIVKGISEGIDAMETKFFQHEGRVGEKCDVIAWGERRQYLQMAVEYG